MFWAIQQKGVEVGDRVGAAQDQGRHDTTDGIDKAVSRLTTTQRKIRVPEALRSHNQSNVAESDILDQ